LTPAKDRTLSQEQVLIDYHADIYPDTREKRRWLRKLDKELAALEPSTALVMEEMAKPRPTYVFKRGDPDSKGQRVRPATPAVLHPLPPDAPSNRLGLAQWLVDPKNPLVARVVVNRWWSELFGRGLVSTPEDFGSRGEPPTHPQLLDWLAVEFMHRGWSMKSIHRLMVTSATYRQSSKVSSELLIRDPDNKLYLRGPRARLSAELIRDNALAASGLLSRKMGGPPVLPPQPPGIWNFAGASDNAYETSGGEDRYRRGLYTIWRRSSPYPSFVAFDASDRSSCIVRRPRTNTPVQALTLMNDPVYLEAAAALAGRILSDHPTATVSEQATYAFRLCLSRPPRDEELNLLEQIYDRALKRYESDPSAARRLLADWPRLTKVDVVQLAAWFQVATVLLNLDETITKG
jgi:hypothetical protein